MESKSTEQQEARALYFQSELSQQQIADRVGVNRKTLYTWIKEGHWLRAKRAVAAAPIFLSEQYYTQLAMINKAIADREERPYPTREEAEIIRKLSITLRHLPANNRASDAIDVFELFIDKLTKTDLDLAKAVMPHMDEHVKYLYERSQGNTLVKDTYAQDADDREYNEWLRQQPTEQQTQPQQKKSQQQAQPTASPVNQTQYETLTPTSNEIPNPAGRYNFDGEYETTYIAPAISAAAGKVTYATAAEQKSLNIFYGVMNRVMNPDKYPSEPAPALPNKENTNTDLSTNGAKKWGDGASQTDDQSPDFPNQINEFRRRA